jgi:hypothetical protein
MERGVVVGGLMICGSFLLAASLNRSAVNEVPRSEPPAAEVPLAPPLPIVGAEKPSPPACASDAHEPAVAEEEAQGDLPGNGREACSQ